MALMNTAPVQVGKIHQTSADSVKASLDLFKVHPTCTSETGGTWISIEPMTDSPTSQIQLQAPASDEHHTDLLNSFIVAKVKVTRKDGADLPVFDNANLKTWPVSNFIHSLFETATLAVNSVDIDHNGAYAQTAFIRALVDKSDEAKKTHLSVEGWLEDGATAQDEADATEAAKTARKKLIAGSRVMSYTFSPKWALGEQDRLLPPGTSLKATFNRASAATCLMSSDEDPDVKISIVKFEWMLRRVSVNPGIVRIHNELALRGETHKYPLRKHRTRTVTIPSGVRYHRIVAEQDGVIPTRLMVTFLPHSAKVGDFKLNAYKYSDFGVSSIELTIDGVPVGKKIETDFESGDYAHAYTHALTSLGHRNTGTSNGVDYTKYGNGRTVFVWATGSDLPNKGSTHYYHLRRKGCTAVTVTFKAALTQPLSVQLTDTREDLVEIDLERRVTSVVGIV